MNQDDLLKKLQKLIKEELRSIRDMVELTKKKVDSQELFLHTTSENVRFIKEQQSIINEKLDEHTRILEDQVLPSVVTIETEIKAYGDMYKINNSNARKLEKRIEVLEGKSDITPPSELTLIDIQ